MSDATMTLEYLETRLAAPLSQLMDVAEQDWPPHYRSLLRRLSEVVNRSKGETMSDTPRMDQAYDNNRGAGLAKALFEKGCEIERENAALREDAERYRYLVTRLHARHVYMGHQITLWEMVTHDPTFDLDLAVDTAMEKAQP